MAIYQQSFFSLSLHTLPVSLLSSIFKILRSSISSINFCLCQSADLIALASKYFLWRLIKKLDSFENIERYLSRWALKISLLIFLISRSIWLIRRNKNSVRKESFGLWTRSTVESFFLLLNRELIKRNFQAFDSWELSVL